MSRCCNSCGILACNKDKPTPQGAAIDWYTQENLDRLWRDIQDSGQFLICHSTDPNAKEYGGSDKIKSGHQTACLGMVIWVYMHIKIFEITANGSFQKYCNLVGHKVALSKRAMGELIFSMAIGSGDLLGRLKIPREFDDKQELSYPTGFEKTCTHFAKIK